MGVVAVRLRSPAEEVREFPGRGNRFSECVSLSAVVSQPPTSSEHFLCVRSLQMFSVFTHLRQIKAFVFSFVIILG